MHAADKRIGVYIVICLFVPLVFGQVDLTQENGKLYEGFRDPSATYRPVMLWYWNSKIEPEEAKHQIDEYLKQGVQGAIVYASTGLKTPFLSEEWWRVWAEILPYARAKGIHLGWHPEFNIPNGDARDMWKDPPNQSRVLEGHPEYRLKRLAYVEHEVSGPGKVNFEDLPNPVLAIAARKVAETALAADSLVDLSSGIHGSSFSAEIGSGNWKVTFYYPALTDKAAWGWTEWQHVDPLNLKATQRYIDLTLGELERRFPEYLGSTFKYVMLDSEGSLGGPIVWTPDFFESFQARKRYDFRRFLPLLVNDGGAITAKIRNDYFDVVSELFVANYFEPIANWCSSRGIEAGAQMQGDSLQMEAGYGGNFMAIQRAMTIPFMEDLGDDFRVVRQFKEPASIAHFEGRRFWSECQLIQGAGSFMSPQKLRYGTNVAAAWGVNLWTQNSSYDDDNAWWPPSPGRSQPHWKYFHHYSDLVRRISYMNDGGRHVADVLLFRPTATVVAASAPAFDNIRGNFFGHQRKGYAEVELVSHAEKVAPTQDIPTLFWGGDFSWQVEMDYWGLMQLLVQKQQDFDVADDFYLDRAKLNSAAIELGEESYHVLVLPPMHVISRVSLEKVRDFYEQGGHVIAYGSLPSGSTEQGGDDTEVIRAVQAIFAIDPRQSEQATEETSNLNKQGGHSGFIPHGLEKVAGMIARLRPQDFQVIKGSAESLFYLHRVKEGHDLYWVANDSSEVREAVLSLAALGTLELWDPTEGTKKKPVYWSQDRRTIIPLNLAAWSGVYLVFGPHQGETVQTVITATNLEDLELEEKTTGVEAKGWLQASEKQASLEGTWKGKPFRIAKENRQPTKRQVLSPQGWEFQVEEQVPIQYAQTIVVGEGEGLDMGFSEAGYNDRAWETAWISRESKTIRDWNLIGPFPNASHQGFNEVYPPERETNLAARYEGADAQQVAWRRHESSTPEINIQKALALTNASAVVYALTYVWSPKAQHAQAILAGENLKLFVNGKEAFKLHAMPVDSELRDGFAFKPMIELKEGWNSLLVKVEHDSNPIAFFLRLSDTEGRSLPKLMFSSRPPGPPARLRGQGAETMKFKERWYRVQVPPGTRALLPSTTKFKAAYLNGKDVSIAPNALVEFGSLDWNHPNVIALVTSAGDELEDSLQFEAGKNNYQLGSWTWTGLSSFSGEGTYEKSFRLAPNLEGKRIELDLGQVGVTAEVWVNDKRVGERAWAPYQLDITIPAFGGEPSKNSGDQQRFEPKS